MKSRPALLEALEYAEDTQSAVWDFAISIQQIAQTGVTETDLRWLVNKEYIQHAREVSLHVQGRPAELAGLLCRAG